MNGRNVGSLAQRVFLYIIIILSYERSECLKLKGRGVGTSTQDKTALDSVVLSNSRIIYIYIYIYIYIEKNSRIIFCQHVMQNSCFVNKAFAGIVTFTMKRSTFCETDALGLGGWAQNPKKPCLPRFIKEFKIFNIHVITCITHYSLAPLL
jgi:hypothetical protein